VQFVSKASVEKTSGVWIDGQYVGYVGELKDDKKVLILHVTMQKDHRAQFPTVTSQLKLQVTPERAAVFLDDGFVGTVREFSGVGRGMLVSPGKHRVKICYPARELRSRRT